MEARMSPEEFYEYAVYREDLEAVELALDHFNVSPNIYLGTKMNTAAHIAVRKNNQELLRLLLSYGADYTILNAEKKSVMDLAIESPSMVCLDIFLDPPAIRVRKRNPNVYSEPEQKPAAEVERESKPKPSVDSAPVQPNRSPDLIRFSSAPVGSEKGRTSMNGLFSSKSPSSTIERWYSPSLSKWLPPS